MTYGNCLIYAVRKRLFEGGEILFRRSHMAERFGITAKWHLVKLVPHFLHKDKEGNITEFLPTEETLARDFKRGVFLTLIFRIFTFWIFKGRINKQ